MVNPYMTFIHLKSIERLGSKISKKILIISRNYKTWDIWDIYKYKQGVGRLLTIYIYIYI